MKRRILSIFFAVICLFFQAVPESMAWGRQGKVVSPEGEVKEIEWNEWELIKDPVKRDVDISPQASFHIIRLSNSEPYHSHETHELVAVVLTGSGKMHFKDRSFAIQKGDVIHVPAGAPHWVENTGKQPIEAYAVFMPPFDGKDFHLLEGWTPPPDEWNE